MYLFEINIPIPETREGWTVKSDGSIHSELDFDDYDDPNNILWHGGAEVLLQRGHAIISIPSDLPTIAKRTVMYILREHKSQITAGDVYIYPVNWDDWANEQLVQKCQTPIDPEERVERKAFAGEKTARQMMAFINSNVATIEGGKSREF